MGWGRDGNEVLLLGKNGWEKRISQAEWGGEINSVIIVTVSISGSVHHPPLQIHNQVDEEIFVFKFSIDLHTDKKRI